MVGQFVPSSAGTMSCRLLICVAVLACGAIAKHGKSQTPKGNPVTSSVSGQFRGSWMQTRRGRQFEAYRGIRYAEPPVGELRFQPPKPILHYKNQVDASEEGPACPLPVPKTYYVDEDCLTINVYTPKNHNKTNLPVVFFIHAGGFYSMTGRSDVVGPHYLLDHDLVFVSINYRLATLGFMSTGDALAPGNNGMKDQVAALKWVRRNIGAFGGAPDLVTIAGCSAGSISVMLHMISPMSKGLFHRGISMSASPINKEPTPHHQRHLAVKQAELLHCPTNSTKEIYDCLKNKPWRELGDSLPGFFIIGYDPVGQWGPVVEPDFGQERFLSIEPLVAIKKGLFHPVPYIIGVTENEFAWNAYTIIKNATNLKRMNDHYEQLAPIAFMLPKDSREVTIANRLKQEYLGGKPLRDDEATAKGLGNIYADSIIRFGVHRLVRLMSKYSPKPVHYYKFSYVGAHSFYEDPDTGKPTGAVHHDDMIYLFTMSYQFPVITPDSPDSSIVDAMTTMWYNFAKLGDPSPFRVPPAECVTWPRVTADHRQYLRIDRKPSLRETSRDRFKLWEELYPIDY